MVYGEDSTTELVKLSLADHTAFAGATVRMQAPLYQTLSAQSKSLLRLNDCNLKFRF